MVKLKTVLKNNKSFLVIFLTPLILSPLPILLQNKESFCAYVVILMSVFWLTEAIPMGVTGLLPVVLFPLFGISPSDKVTSGYFKDIVMLFFGGLTMANAIEMTRLHERIALKVLMSVGSNPKWLMLGFMAITGFLSLWISNMAATSMMLPVIEAIVKQLVKHDKVLNKNVGKIDKTTIMELENLDQSENVNNEIQKHLDNPDEPEALFKNEKGRKLACGFLLSSAYSATIGGIGSLVGTAPNVILKGFFDENYPDAKLGFLTFMLFSLPVAIIMILIAWVWLSIRWLPRDYIRCSKKGDADNDQDELKELLQKKYKELGRPKWSEKCVGVIFLLLVVLWITRDLHVVPGWNYFFKPKFISDTTPAIFAVVLLFMCPGANIFKGHPYSNLIEWRVLQKIFPWNIIFLSAGSLAIADGFQASGLSIWIGNQMKTLATGSKEITLIVVMLVTAVTTEFTSNTSIASIFLPIINSLSKQSGTGPCYLLIPMILTVSLAFMLPIATPNNAIVFSTGHLTVIDMISTGFVLNISGLLIVYLASNTWLGLIFDVSSRPLNATSYFFNATSLTKF